MENFGLVNLWEQGDVLLHAITIILLLMSLLSWVVMISKALDLLRLRRMAKAAQQRFWFADSWEHGLQSLADGRRNPFRQLAETGFEAINHQSQQPQLADAMNTSDWLTRNLKSAIDDGVERLQSGLTILASVGSTAPFVGLLGTVWGIYHALIKIGSTGSASLDQVAGPVGEALIMTALGLIVAIPAVLGYNAINRANKNILSRLGRFAHDLHAYFITGARLERESGKSVAKTVVTAKAA